MEDPTTSRRPRASPGSPPPANDVLSYPPPPSSPRALRTSSDTPSSSNGDHTNENANESNPVSLLSASSPSRAFSRIWDRFSPPSISSPFSLPQHAPSPSFRRARAGSESPPVPNASPARSEDFTRRRVPPRLEQHDSASQLSFSLRRASSGAGAAAANEANLFRGRTASGSSSLADSWESFRLPGVAKWRSIRDKGKEVATTDSASEEVEEDVFGDGAEDEACFVDEWTGKVGKSLSTYL